MPDHISDRDSLGRKDSMSRAQYYRQRDCRVPCRQTEKAEVDSEGSLKDVKWNRKLDFVGLRVQAQSEALLQGRVGVYVEPWDVQVDAISTDFM